MLQRLSRFADRTLWGLAAFSLVAIFALRLVAAWGFRPLVTPWDDGAYRVTALATASSQSGMESARTLVLPHKPVLLEGRLNGYNDWLTIALEVHQFLGIGSAEVTFQTLNTLLLLLQALAVYFFARWSFGERTSAMTVTFLVIAAPVVFGTSRWVHAENLVLLTGFVLSSLTAWLLTPAAWFGRRGLWLQRGRVVLAAWGIGLCFTTREYAAPSLLLLTGCLELALLARRRWFEAAVVVMVVGAFAVPWAPVFVNAVNATLGKGNWLVYFHPLTEWIPHVAFHTIGPALTVVLLAVGCIVLYQRSRFVVRLFGGRKNSPGRLLLAELTGAGLVFWAHVVLLAFYSAGIVWARNRVTRPAIMLLLAGVGIVLIGIRLLPILRARLQRPMVRLVALGLVVSSWLVLGYQLLIAFDGGKTYGHAAYRLEYFNYPLRLRDLKDGFDGHWCGTECPYDKP